MRKGPSCSLKVMSLAAYCSIGLTSTHLCYDPQEGFSQLGHFWPQSSVLAPSFSLFRVWDNFDAPVRTVLDSPLPKQSFPNKPSFVSWDFNMAQLFFWQKSL